MSPEYRDSVLTRETFEEEKRWESDIFSLGMVVLFHLMNAIRTFNKEKPNLDMISWNTD